MAEEGEGGLGWAGRRHDWDCDDDQQLPGRLEGELVAALTRKELVSMPKSTLGEAHAMFCTAQSNVLLGVENRTSLAMAGSFRAPCSRQRLAGWDGHLNLLQYEASWMLRRTQSAVVFFGGEYTLLRRPVNFT